MAFAENNLITNIVFISMVFFAGLSPFLVEKKEQFTVPNNFRWPKVFEGRALIQLPLSSRETQFSRGFPGKIARFTDGSREIIIRWLSEPSRRLHPAMDCFEALGYAIKPLPIDSYENGVNMSCFSAESSMQSLKVCEYVTNGKNLSWPDISSWYWHALFNGSEAGWWSYVVADVLWD